MKLKPAIASYSGQSYRAIRRALDDPAVLNVVATVAQSSASVALAGLDAAACRELIEMHVLAEQDGSVRLDTAVFLEADIRRINAAWSAFAPDLVGEVAGAAADWKSYGGRYAQSKLDFDEVCAAQAALGPDLLNKTVLWGESYTAVFIGPGGCSYPIWDNPIASRDPAGRYVRQLDVFLTDAYAMLLSGRLEHAALRAAGEAAGLYHEGQPASFVLTGAAIDRYLPTIRAVASVVESHFRRGLGGLRDLLASTAAGRQGVPAANMMLHLWRYLRRAIAAEGYAAGLFRDRARQTGVTMVFYENNVQVIDELLR